MVREICIYSTTKRETDLACLLVRDYITELRERVRVRDKTYKQRQFNQVNFDDILHVTGLLHT